MYLTRLIRRIVAPAFFGLTAAAPSLAAEFTIANDLKPHLQELVYLYGQEAFSHPLKIDRPDDIYFDGYNVIRMDGVIEQGDAERFGALYSAVQEETGHYPYVLVMNSPGGNFLEGIKLGEMLGTEAYIDAIQLKAVVVLEGDRCLSACALAFALSGSSDSQEPRIIEDGGVIGFHMGMLPEKAQRTQAEVGQIMSLTYDVMQSYLSLLRDGRNPLTLLMEALNHRTADSFFYLGAEPRAFDLGFAPAGRGLVAQPVSAAAMDVQTVGHLCNLMAWSLPGLADEIDLDFWQFPSFWRDKTKNNMSFSDLLKEKNVTVLLGTVGNGERCLAGIDENGALRMTVPSWRSVQFADVDCSTSEEAWCRINTQDINAADLPPVSTSSLAFALDCPNGQLPEQWGYWTNDNFPEEPAERVAFDRSREVTRTVRLRAMPGLDTESLGEVAAQTTVELLGCPDDIRQSRHMVSGANRWQSRLDQCAFRSARARL